MKLPVPITLILLLSVFAGSDLYASTRTVTKIDDTNDGVCDVDCSLREAIAVSANGDSVVFSSLFSSTQSIILTGGQIEFSKSINILGPGRNLLSISGNNSTRIFKITGNVTVEMMQMTLRDARVAAPPPDVFGGAILVTGATLSLSDVVLANNYIRFDFQGDSLGWGGGVHCDQGTLNVTASLLSGNTAPLGAGVSAWNSVVNVTETIFENNIGVGLYGESANTITVATSTFTGNAYSGINAGSNGQISISDSVVSQNGGGIVIEGGEATIVRTTIVANLREVFGGAGAGIFNRGATTLRNCLIANNRADDRGGGIWNVGTVYLLDSLVTGNTAFNSGGGIWNATGQVYATNTTISGNRVTSSVGAGGGVYNLINSVTTSSSIFLVNSTIAFNHAGGNGGGIRNDTNGLLRSSNSIIAKNTSGTSEVDISGVVSSNGFNLIGSIVGNSGWRLNSDLLNKNPLLAPLADNGGSTLTHALLAGSPAINAGSNQLAIEPQTMLPLKTDQRGSERYFGGFIDIGAFESVFPAVFVTVRGRVTTAGGRGLPITRMILDDGTGGLTYGITNPFGYFRFQNLVVGRTYTISANHKYFVFDSPRILTITTPLDDINFVAVP